MAANGLSVLNDIARQVGYLNAALCDAKKERDKQIAALLDAGYSEREIALAAGLSGPRVNQIKKAVHA